MDEEHTAADTALELEHRNRNAKHLDDDGRAPRTGTVWTASAHIITAVIGSGVLSLAWAMAQLGWILGIAVLIAFAMVTYYSSVLLSDCYRSPDPVTGKRNYTYMDAVKANLGRTQIWLCGLTQYTNLWGTAVGYTITASISMAAITRSNCFHEHGKLDPCHRSNNPYMIVFGIVQSILSQIPDFHRLWWLSIMAAVMSFSYSLIGLGLCLGKIAEGNHHRTVSGVGSGTLTSAQKVWHAFQALGNIAFAYSYSMILIEIQDTVKSGPAENKTMKKATALAVSSTTMFYMLSGVLGYLAFGNSAPGNILTGFGFYDPFWLVDFANACLVIHLVGAYQVFVQPVFYFIELWCAHTWPKSPLIHKELNVKLPGFSGVYKLSVLRLIWRSFFVVTATVISMLLPFFNDVLALLGAVGFWPLTVYFPVEMYIAQQKIQRFSSKWILLQTLSAVCFLVSVASAVGSIEGIIQDLRTYKPFTTNY